MSRPPGHQARKRFGQNFLQDEGVITEIIRALAPNPDEKLLEIGPGLGALTEHLLEETGGQLDVIELDRDLIPILRTRFFNHPGLTIHQADALKFDFASAPLLIAFILAPIGETAIRQALLMSMGSLEIFFTRPISLAFLILTVVTIIGIIRGRYKRKAENQ